MKRAVYLAKATNKREPRKTKAFRLYLAKFPSSVESWPSKRRRRFMMAAQEHEQRKFYGPYAGVWRIAKPYLGRQLRDSDWDELIAAFDRLGDTLPSGRERELLARLMGATTWWLRQERGEL